MGETGDIFGFDGSAPFDLADPSALLKAVPARWVVYCLFGGSDEAGSGGERPVQLLCVKNLRQSLKRRLSDDPEAEPSKRVDYRALVKRVAWCRVESRFEADLRYLRLARGLFPASYGELVPARPTWFLHVDPDAEFPRFVRTTDLSQRSGEYIGPIEDRTSAGKLVEQVESAFDLCRYHNVLTAAPNGKPCAYKEMKRCPAPCDGSIGMEQYRRMVELGLRVLLDPADTVREHEGRMRQAAAELKFEVAGRIKQFVAELSAFGKGPYRHARRLADFEFVVLQRGPREGTAKLFLVLPGRVSEEIGLLGEPVSASPVLRSILEAAERLRSAIGHEGVSSEGAEVLATVAYHLFAPKAGSGPGNGVFLPLAELNDRSLPKAFKELQKQKPVDAAEESEEGVMQESQTVLIR